MPLRDSSTCAAELTAYSRCPQSGGGMWMLLPRRTIPSSVSVPSAPHPTFPPFPQCAVVVAYLSSPGCAFWVCERPPLRGCLVVYLQHRHGSSSSSSKSCCGGGGRGRRRKQQGGDASSFSGRRKAGEISGRRKGTAPCDPPNFIHRASTLQAPGRGTS